MFRIFRSKRQGNTYTKRISKYFLYAFGEIVLVIIGILIALYINNWNQERQQTNKVEAILQELLKDLETDIIRSGEALELQRNKDSLIQLVLLDAVTIDDYKRDGYLRNLLFNNQTMSFSDNSYESLVQHIDQIPVEYEHLIPILNVLYKDKQPDVQGAIDKVHNYVMETLQKWTNEEEWFDSYIVRKEGEDYYNYVIEGEKYKNVIALYKVLLIDNLNVYTIAYHHEAVMAYRAVASVLEEPFPECVTSYVIDISRDELDNYVGDYTMPENDNIANISIAGEDLRLSFDGRANNYQLWPRTKAYFFNHQMKLSVTFIKSEDNSRDTLYYQTPNYQAKFIRMARDTFSKEETE